MMKQLISAVVDSTIAVSAFAGLVGMLIYYLVLYGCGIGVIVFSGIIYTISSAGFMEAVNDVHSVVQAAHTGGADWSPVSGYGAYLLLTAIIASFFGGRVAGRLAPEKEYWASGAMIVIIYSIAYFSDGSDFAPQAWFSYLLLLASVIAALAGARKARHINLIGF